MDILLCDSTPEFLASIQLYLSTHSLNFPVLYCSQPLLLTSMKSAFSNPNMGKIMWYMPFCAWFISLN